MQRRKIFRNKSFIFFPISTTTKWKFQAPSLSFFFLLFPSIFTCLFFKTVFKTVIEYRNLHWIAQFFFSLLCCLHLLCLRLSWCIIRFYAAFSANFLYIIATQLMFISLSVRTIAHNKVKRSFRLKNIRVEITKKNPPQKLL